MEETVIVPEAVATLKNARISARKVKIVADLIRGKKVSEALAIVKFAPKASAEIIEKYFQKDLTKNLSQSALEILAIVAYRQPITRVEIDDIRGVNSSGALQTLVWRGLIETNGKKEAPGHPKLYVTTDYFLQYFNYQSLADLPLIEDFEDSANNEEIDLFDPKKTDQDTQKEGQ